jgi:hypothetical protein
MKRTQRVDDQQPPNFGQAIAVVAERVKSFKEIAITVVTVASAVAGAGFGAWMYFASRDELRKQRCLIEAQATIDFYNERIDLYELLADAKVKIKAVLANELDKLSEAGKLEQIARIGGIDRELEGIKKRKEIAEEQNKTAIRTLNLNKCPTDQDQKAADKGKKE